MASAAGIALLLAVLLALVVRNAAPLAQQLGVAVVRGAVALLLLAGAGLVGFLAFRLGASGGEEPITIRVTEAAIVYRRGRARPVEIPWASVHGLSRFHAEGGDSWALRSGERLFAWDDSVGQALRLQNLVLGRAGLVRRERSEGTAGAWEAHWSR